jgi:hypothetical protein
MPRDIETVPDLVGFAAPNGQEGKPRTKFVAVLRDKFPKHINHSIICIGASIAPVQPFEALGVAIPPSSRLRRITFVRMQHRLPPRLVFHVVLITRWGRGEHLFRSKGISKIVVDAARPRGSEGLIPVS